MTEELTPEQKKEEKRNISLNNLASSTITDLASAYFVEKGNQYGEAGSSAIENFKYLPALQSDEGSQMFMGNLIESRQDGRRYSGNVSEYKIISDCAKIVQESLASIKVEDVLGLMGSRINIDEKYKGKYVSELGEDDMKAVIGMYTQFFTDLKVSEAINMKAGHVRSGLEEILGEPERETINMQPRRNVAAAA